MVDQNEPPAQQQQQEQQQQQQEGHETTTYKEDAGSLAKAEDEPTTSANKKKEGGCCKACECKACDCCDSLLEEEKEVRHKALHNPILLLIVNSFSALVVFFMNLVSMEMVISVGLSIGLTVYVYNQIIVPGEINDATNNSSSTHYFDGLSMDFVILSFAVITPISNTITMAFNRREKALDCTAQFRATMLEIYKAHALWDWDQKPGRTDTSGRIKSSVNWEQHADQTATEIVLVSCELYRYLTLPNSTRARHRAMPHGKAEAKRTNAFGEKLYQSMLVRLARITDLCEVLKREGIPGNEAARIRQWERFLVQYIEQLRVIKHYRTPQALRSFGRLFSMILPPFYAPFFAEMGFRLESLSMGIVFAVLTSVALTGLFETVSQFEDPFVKRSFLDGVHVRHELVDSLTPALLAIRTYAFPHAPDFSVTCAGKLVAATTTPKTEQQKEEGILDVPLIWRNQ